MHRALTARWLNRALSIGEATPSAGVPLFLCPAVGYERRCLRKPFAPASRSAICARRLNHTEATISTTSDAPTPAPPPATPIEQHEVPTRKLPLTCSGCGSFVQTNDPQQFGYYDLESKRVRKWTHPQSYEPKRVEREADHVVDEVLKNLDPSRLEELGLSASVLVSGEESGGTGVPCK